MQKKRLITAAILTILCAVLVFVPMSGLDPAGKGVLLVFLWAILMWIVRPIPEYLVGVLAAAILAIFFGQKANVVSGFATSGWWLCLWAGFIGSVIKFSGLGERVAYWILVKLTKSELSANYATSLANTVLSLMIPSNTARGAVMSPICDNICEGMGYKRGEHKGDAAIMLSNLYTNTTNTWLFYTAVGANAIGMALVEEMTGQSISWTGWLKATCSPAGIIVLLIPLITNFLFGTRKGEKRSIDIEFAKKKLEEMGPLTVKEKKAAIYFALTLLAFCTNGIHHVAPDYVVFVTIFLMLCPGIGVCSFKDVGPNFAWPAFIQLGFAMSLASCVNKTGGFQWLVDAMFTTNPAFSAMDPTLFITIWLAFVVELCGRAARHLRRHERYGSRSGSRQHDDGRGSWLRRLHHGSADRYGHRPECKLPALQQRSEPHLRFHRQILHGSAAQGRNSHSGARHHRLCVPRERLVPRDRYSLISTERREGSI